MVQDAGPEGTGAGAGAKLEGLGGGLLAGLPRPKNLPKNPNWALATAKVKARTKKTFI